VAHRLIVLRHGEVVEEGPAAEIFSNPQQAYTRDLMAAAFKLAAPASEEEEDDEVEVL
jgi:microcin C transport system ATP-binding protein